MAQLDKYIDQSCFICDQLLLHPFLPTPFFVPLCFPFPFKLPVGLYSSINFHSPPHGLQSYQSQSPDWSSWKWCLCFLDSPSFGVTGDVCFLSSPHLFGQVCISVDVLSGFPLFLQFPSWRGPPSDNLAGTNVLTILLALIN